MYLDPTFVAFLSIFLVGMALTTLTGTATPFSWTAGCLSALLLLLTSFWFAFYIPYVFFFMIGLLPGLAINNAYRDKPRTKIIVAAMMVAVVITLVVLINAL